MSALEKPQSFSAARPSAPRSGGTRLASPGVAEKRGAGAGCSRRATLIVPRRHAVTIWDLTDEEYAACFALVREARKILEPRHQPEGFNVGVNCGVFGGQSVMHAHIHLIPRYRGDVPDPRGGVRYIIPHKAHY